MNKDNVWGTHKRSEPRHDDGDPAAPGGVTGPPVNAEKDSAPHSRLPPTELTPADTAVLIEALDDWDSKNAHLHVTGELTTQEFLRRFYHAHSMRRLFRTLTPFVTPVPRETP